MDNREFDQFIKNRLQDLGGSSVPDWNRMEESVTHWEIREGLVDDQTFDELIAEKLETIETTPSEFGWTKLATKIDYQKSFGKRIISLQLAGAAIILLLLMLLYQFYPGKTDFYPKDYIVEESTPEATEKVEITNVKPDPTAEQSVKLNTKLNQEKEPLSGSLNSGNGVTDTETLYNGSKQRAEIVQTQRLSGNTEDIVEGNLVENLPGNNEEIMVESTSGNNSLSNTLLMEVERNVLLLNELPRKIFQCIETGNLEYAMVDNPLVWRSDDFAQMTNQRKKGWQLSASATPQLAMVRSPFDLIMNEPGYSRNFMNVSTGLSVGFRIGDFELSGGLGYNQLSYTPRKVEESIDGGSASLHLASISADFISLPLNLVYFWHESPKVSWYSGAGMTFRALMSAEYEVHRTEQGLTSLINDLRTNPAYRQTLVSQKDFESGLMDGGDPGNALLAGISVSTGAQIHIDQNWSVFLEPGVSLDLSGNGFGPNHDKINYFSIRTGVVAKLN